MFEEVDLAILCSEVVAQLAPWVYENEHSLELLIQAHDVCVKAVPALLKDALRNLIENAVRHTPHATNILVKVVTRGVEVEDRLATARQAPADSVHPSDGLGIGLKIVERIAELHKGSLRHALTKQGHIFYLELARTDRR